MLLNSKKMQEAKSFKIFIDNNSFTFTLDKRFRFDISEDKPTDIHVHADYEIFILVDGMLNIQTNDDTLTFGPNKLIIIPPFIRHYIIKNSKSRCYHFLLSFSSKKDKIDTLLNSLNELFIPDAIGDYTIDGENFDVYCNDLSDALSEEYTFVKSKIDALLTLITLKISSLSLKNVQENSFNIPKTNYSDEIYRMIAKHCTENIKIGDVANKLFLSERQISRIIKKNYSKTFSQLLLEHRLSAAALLLTKTSLSIKQIISKVNFETESYFFILFKKYYSISPLQYRKKMLKKTGKNRKVILKL